MPYRVNGKNLAVGRLMVRGKDAEKRMKYIHVSPRGTSVVTPHLAARVSLPDGNASFGTNVVIPQAQIDKVKTNPFLPDVVDLPEGEPAMTGPHYVVPQFDNMFPEADDQVSSFTCNGDLLRKMLTVACEVSEDSNKTVRLRICKDSTSETGKLRVDIYRQPGKQEFVGVIKETKYNGRYIPGEKVDGKSVVEEKPQQAAMMLKVATGRKFRGAGE